MPLYKFQVAGQMDSILARDSLVNTLYFDDRGIGSDPQNLCDDLRDIFDTGWYANPTQLVVTAYEVGPAPQYPKARSEVNMGLSPASSCSREVAICLSYYGTRNLPRQRGRIYLPLCASSYADSTPRPPAARMAQVLALASAFSDLGGADVDWVVHSPTTNSEHTVTNAWVDDEWDTVRSRGLRGTTRLLLPVDE